MSETQLQIIQGLIELRKRGEIFGIWCDAGLLRIRKFMWSDLEYITWSEAAELIK